MACGMLLLFWHTPSPQHFSNWEKQPCWLSGLQMVEPCMFAATRFINVFSHPGWVPRVCAGVLMAMA